MKKVYFPYLAAALCLTFLPIILLGNTADEEGVRVVPLLSLLVINEFAFFVAIAGAYIGIQHLLVGGFKPFYGLATLVCIVLSIQFAVLGFQMWPL